MARVSWETGADVAVGQQYGKVQLPHDWEAMLEITGVSDTGDGSGKKIIGYSPINSPNYGPYAGGDERLFTSPSGGAKYFSDVPSFLIVSGYVKDVGGTGIENVTVSDGTDSDDTNSSGYWAFITGTVPYSGILTPSKTGYEFTPTDITVSNRYWYPFGNNFVGALAPPGKATNPAPSDNAEEVIKGLVKLEWDAP